MLRGDAHTGRYWVGGVVPAARDGKGERWSCPSQLRAPSLVESSPFCAERWPAPRALGQPPRTMYAVGIGNVWGFEDMAATQLGYAVEAFDPTRRLRLAHTNHATPGVRFHYAGLGDGRAGAAESKNAYGAVDPRVLMTLREMKALGGGRPIDVLKVDCEGCEWAAFQQIQKETPTLLNETSVVFVEAHITPTLLSPRDEAQFSALFDFLVNKLQMRLWYMRDNIGFRRDRAVVDFLAALGARPRQCCYELAFYRELPAKGGGGGEAPAPRLDGCRTQGRTAGGATAYDRARARANGTSGASARDARGGIDTWEVGGKPWPPTALGD
jgi:hypothetical protein